MVAANCPSNKEKSVREIKKYNVARFNTNQREKRLKNIKVNGHRIKALIDIDSDVSLMREDSYRIIETPALANRPIKFYDRKKTKHSEKYIKTCTDCLYEVPHYS